MRGVSEHDRAHLAGGTAYVYIYDDSIKPAGLVDVVGEDDDF